MSPGPIAVGIAAVVGGFEHLCRKTRTGCSPGLAPQRFLDRNDEHESWQPSNGRRCAAIGREAISISTLSVRRDAHAMLGFAAAHRYTGAAPRIPGRVGVPGHPKPDASGRRAATGAAFVCEIAMDATAIRTQLPRVRCLPAQLPRSCDIRDQGNRLPVAIAREIWQGRRTRVESTGDSLVRPGCGCGS